MHDTTILSFAALDAALSRCMKIHAPTPPEHRLHPDANRMAGLWSDMVLRRLQEVQLGSADHELFAAVERWSL